MPYATNNGVRIYYEVEGAGPPLILHHGSFGSGEDWRELGYTESLKHEYQLILLVPRVVQNDGFELAPSLPTAGRKQAWRPIRIGDARH